MFLKVSNSIKVFLVFSTILTINMTAHAADGPWTLSDALGLEDGFTLSGEHQSRFEHYDGNVFAGTSPNDGVFFIRTTLDAQYNRDRFGAQIELTDSRQGQADRHTRLSTAHVSTLDLLQANVSYKFGENNASQIRVGRFTEDWGSRTLMARNRFRNTINTFDGVLFKHQQANGNEFKFISAQPVRRTPRDLSSLLDNEHRSDKSSDALRIHGVFADLPNFLPSLLRNESFDLAFDTYYIALKEKDTTKLQTSNRDLHTFGFRIRSTPAVKQWDISLESIFQIGERRASSNPIDTRDLDHRAFYQRVELAYSFDTPSRLRAIFELNYASGDESPLDGDSGRFDSLFGVTAFEFGPVSLYAPINRSNIVTPGIRLTSTPWRNVALMADYRHFWLAQERDSWGRTGQRDVSGNSGSYMGQHLELRARWSVVPGNVRIDSGVIFLNAKNLIDQQSEFFYVGTKIDF
ncbi:MAG: alginate export family protein [Pseudohongiellaceae bacterium]